MKTYRVGGCVRDQLLEIPVSDIDWVVTGAAIITGKLFTMDNYRSLQTPNVCEAGDNCSTSLRQYIREIGVLFTNKKHYDRFRKQLPR